MLEFNNLKGHFVSSVAENGRRKIEEIVEMKEKKGEKGK